MMSISFFLESLFFNTFFLSDKNKKVQNLIFCNQHLKLFLFLMVVHQILFPISGNTNSYNNLMIENQSDEPIN